MESEYLQLGTLGIIFFFAIKEFFSYLRTRNNDKIDGGGYNYKNNNNEEEHRKLFNHAEVANKEMGQIRIDIALIQQDIKYIKNNIEKINV